MKNYIKFLIIAAFMIPIFVELRTVIGFLDYEISLLSSLTIAIVISLFVVIFDEKFLSEKEN